MPTMKANINIFAHKPHAAAMPPNRTQPGRTATLLLPALRSFANFTGTPWPTPKPSPSPHYLKTLKDIEDPFVIYPDYFTAPIHGYGNLGFLQAQEQEYAMTFFSNVTATSSPATSSPLSPRQSLLTNHAKAIAKRLMHKGAQTLNIADFGGGTGGSSEVLLHVFQRSNLTLVDLSPWYLAQAVINLGPLRRPIRYLHSSMEQPRLPPSSFDAISCTYVFHEMPQSAIRNTIDQAAALLKPRGAFGIMDDNPQHPQIAALLKLPKPIQTAIANCVGEPYIFQYYTADIPKYLKEAGFENIEVIATGSRARTILATKSDAQSAIS